MAKSKRAVVKSGKDSHPLTHKPVDISRQGREKMISEAAYYLAMNRGFSPGNELDDWVHAEQEIDSKLMLKLER